MIKTKFEPYPEDFINEKVNYLNKVWAYLMTPVDSEYMDHNVAANEDNDG